MRFDDAAGNTRLPLPDGEGTGAAKEDGKVPEGPVGRVVAKMVTPFTMTWALVGKVVAPFWWGPWAYSRPLFGLTQAPSVVQGVHVGVCIECSGGVGGYQCVFFCQKWLRLS